jgi:phage terminase small subunit
MATKRKKRLSDNQLRFVRAIKAGRSLTHAALVAGYSPKNAGQSGYQVLKHLRKRVPNVLDRRMELDIEAIIREHLIRSCTQMQRRSLQRLARLLIL